QLVHENDHPLRRFVAVTLFGLLGFLHWAKIEPFLTSPREHIVDGPYHVTEYQCLFVVVQLGDVNDISVPAFDAAQHVTDGNPVLSFLIYEQARVAVPNEFVDVPEETRDRPGL